MPGHRRATCTENRWWQHVKWGLVPGVLISSPSGQYREKTLSPPSLIEGASWWRCLCQAHYTGQWRNIWFLPQRSYTTRTNTVTLQPEVTSSFLPKHTRTTLLHAQEERLLFWRKTALFCLQVGRYTDPEILILHTEFSLFMALIPIWSLQIYLLPLHTLQIASSTS